MMASESHRELEFIESTKEHTDELLQFYASIFDEKKKNKMAMTIEVIRQENDKMRSETKSSKNENT